MSIVLQSTGGGSVTINEPTTASNFTQTLPAVSGQVQVQNNMPAFSAYPSAGTSIGNVTFTKIAINTKDYDTNNNFNTTNNRFTPTVAGYYQVNGRISFSANLTSCFCVIFKNGSEAFRGTGGILNSPLSSSIIYMNGSTDYIELYGFQNSGSSFTTGNAYPENYFQAVMVRAA